MTRLSRRAEDQIESTGLLISAMVMLELEMLYEKNAIAYSAAQILSDLNLQMGISVCQLPMAVIVGSALAIKWIRDPGDRIIVANAIANGSAPLITSDHAIREQYRNAIW